MTLNLHELSQGFEENSPFHSFLTKQKVQIGNGPENGIM
jgi:hypothetical protein